MDTKPECSETCVENAEPKKPRKKYNGIPASRKRKIIADDEKGIKDPEYEVLIGKTGKKFVRKRPNIDPQEIPRNIIRVDNPIENLPIKQIIPEPKEHKESKKDFLKEIMFFNSNQQFATTELSKRIDDIQKVLDKQGNKHKKLKQKYKKLKHEAFTELDYDDEDDEPRAYHAPNEKTFEKPIYQQPRNMRDVIDYRKYFNK